jgi:multidrug efflux pump subunit AcrB
MRLTHLFIDRPRFATVISIFVTALGLGALAILPVAQYPEIVPPTVRVTTSYPGASAETVARTVATPLEQQINGVENMLYMSSQSTGDGNLTITVTFRIGTDLNVAQMLTQNRVQDALSRLPEDVQRLGVQVRKAIPSILLAIHLYSPDTSRDTLYLSNYADAAHQGRVSAPPRRRRCPIPGGARICDAHLARPGQGCSLQSQRQRGARGATRAEPTGLGRHFEPTADPGE